MKKIIRLTVFVLFVSILGGYIGSFIQQRYSYEKNLITQKEKGKENIQASEAFYVEKSDLKKSIKDAFQTTVEINVDVVGQDIFNQEIKSRYAGSGVVISDDGYIVTNDHVVDKGSKFQVTFANGEVKEAKLVGKDAKTDLALLKVDGKNLSYAKFENSDNYDIGDNVIVVGNPLGKGLSVTTGIISAKERNVELGNETFNLIQTNAAVNQGNSGGGLFNGQGKLIGIINSKVSGVGVEGVGYAIPSNQVYDIYKELKEFGYIKSRATLAVAVKEIEDNFYFEDGLYIVKVLEGGSADKAGLKKADRIVSLNGKEIDDYKDLNAELKKYKVNDTIKLEIERDRKKMVVEVKLYPNPSNEQ